MEKSVFYNLVQNKKSRNTVVTIVSDNDWYKLNSNWTVLGIQKKFNNDYRDTYFRLNFTNEEMMNYSNNRKVEFDKVIESLDLGRSKTGKGVNPAWLFE